MAEELREPIRSRVTSYGEVLDVRAEHPMLQSMAESFQMATASGQLPRTPVREGETWNYDLRWPVPNLGTELHTTLLNRLKQIEETGRRGPRRWS